MDITKSNDVSLKSFTIVKQNCDAFDWSRKSRDYGMTHSTGKSLVYDIIDFRFSENVTLP